MELTPDQQEALDNIIQFVFTPVKTRDDVAGILYAAAGCGKTFLTRVIVNKLRGTHRIAGVAPTHKARKVLDGFLNGDTLLKIKTMTIASLLNTMRSHSYIGTKRYTRGADSKIHLFDLFLIDEASMITDNDVTLIISSALEFKRKVLFIGDKYQIPNPSQKYICRGGIATKRDSIAFDLPHSFELTTNLRQAENNPIINIYTELRDAIAECREPQLSRKSKLRGKLGIRFYTNKEHWFDAIKETYQTLCGVAPPQATTADCQRLGLGTSGEAARSKSLAERGEAAKVLGNDIHNTRILAYTNDTVKSHNLMIRRLFQRGPKPEVGELLMGYNNLGWPEKIIENSQDYYVTAVEHTTTHTIEEDSGYKSKPRLCQKHDDGLVGDLLTIKETDSAFKSVIFIPDLTFPANQELLQDLVKRAEQVNKRNSTKDAFKWYCQLKNKLVFMENVYKYGTEIMGEGNFRTSNPLLFKSVGDMIEDLDDGDRTVLDNKLVRDVTSKYGEILTERVGDDKPLAGTERLCDRYCVIEKDLDYAFCITSHKSQGSNFTTVFVDEADFDKLHDYWSYNLDCQINVTKERNQLKYVSFTRPTTCAHVFYRK
uniref:RecD helicase /ATP-dependent exoDNAse n=1 Tax=Marseillevirus LCMAC201 TaxID=2506605 RepID=A0A481YY17_9VIRU|nr:MAG: RecD helicase /ATP-dependent exoDNAse [Marseillevirus LCMAC201]